MKVWTVILAGVLLAALPNLGSGVLEDAGVFVSHTYTKFTRRVIPVNTFLMCYSGHQYEWFRINKFESLLLEFEKGNNSMNATISLGTPSILLGLAGKVDFEDPLYCKNLPKAWHNATKLHNSKVSMTKFSRAPFEYYAVRINNTERATIKKGWNYLINVVKRRFPNNTNTRNYEIFVVEKTAAGVIYVGAVQDLSQEWNDKRTLADHRGYLY